MQHGQLLGFLGLFSKLGRSGGVLLQICSPKSSTNCVCEDEEEVQKRNHFQDERSNAETVIVSTCCTLQSD